MYVNYIILAVIVLCPIVCYIKLRNMIVSNEQIAQKRQENLNEKIKSSCDSVSAQLKRAIQSEHMNVRSDIASKGNEIKRHIEAGFNMVYNKIDAFAANFDERINGLSTSVQNVRNEVKKQASDILKTFEVLYKLESDVNDGVNTITSLCNAIRKEQTQENVEVKKEFARIEDVAKYIEYKLSQHCTTTERYMKNMEAYNEAIIKITHICQEISNVSKDIQQQETSVATMINKHQQIAELTDELNRTAKDVFGLMKLLLMSSIVENSRHLESKINSDVQYEHLSVDKIKDKVKGAIKKNSEEGILVKHCNVNLSVQLKGIGSKQFLGLLGNIPEFGDWDPEKVLKLGRNTDGIFKLDVDVSTAKPIIEFKYVIVDRFGKILQWENGGNRQINIGLLKDGNYERTEKLSTKMFQK